MSGISMCTGIELQLETDCTVYFTAVEFHCSTISLSPAVYSLLPLYYC